MDRVHGYWSVPLARRFRDSQPISPIYLARRFVHHISGRTMDSVAVAGLSEAPSPIRPNCALAPGDHDFVLTIVVPCFNEARTIRRLVDAVRCADIRNKEIIIIDDCSTDGTADILRNEIEPLGVKVIYHSVNRGKGAALKTGFRRDRRHRDRTGRRPRIRPAGIS